MKKLLLTILISLAYFCSISAQQRELTITEMNDDNAAIIEINGQNPQEAEFMQMLLGFDGSSHAWLKTTTNHHLSFWTKDTKRMTVNNWGGITINDLAGTTSRPVFANVNGLLYRQEHVNEYVTYAGPDFHASSDEFLILPWSVKHNFGVVPNFAWIYLTPSIPHTKFRISGVTFYFKDNDANDNFYFEVRSNSFTNWGADINAKPNVASSFDTKYTLNCNYEYDQSDGQIPVIRVNFPIRDLGDNPKDMLFYRCVIKYKKID